MVGQGARHSRGRGLATRPARARGAWGSGARDAAVVDVDVLNLDPREWLALLEWLVHVDDEDNERFLLKLNDCIDMCATGARSSSSSRSCSRRHMSSHGLPSPAVCLTICAHFILAV
jgi:hypothetical protein